MLDSEGEMCNFVLDMLKLDVFSKSEIVLLYSSKPRLLNTDHSMAYMPVTGSSMWMLAFYSMGARVLVYDRVSKNQLCFLSRWVCWSFCVSPPSHGLAFSA